MNAISNELRGAALFFSRAEKQDFGTDATLPELAAPTEASGAQTPGRPDVLASRHLDTKLDLNTRAEARQTLRLTKGEFRRLGPLQETLSEQLDVTGVEKNDILRAALHRLFEEYEELDMG